MDDRNLAAGVMGGLNDLDLNWDALTEFIDMAYDSDMTTGAGMEGMKSGDGILERLTTERAKPLVDEKRID